MERNEIPSDDQMSVEQRGEVEHQFDLERAEVVEEERKTEAIEPSDDPGA